MISVGNMCIFIINEATKEFDIGKVLQFAYYKEKNKKAKEYSAQYASTASDNIGVLCTWYRKEEGTSSFNITSDTSHNYRPIATYLCTLAPISFEQDPLGMSTAEKYLLAKELVLHPSIKSEILLLMNKRKITIEEKDIPKIVPEGNSSSQRTVWVKFNGAILRKTHKSIITKGQYLTDEHITMAQDIIKHQFPEINGLFLSVEQRKRQLPEQMSCQITDMPTLTHYA